MKVLTQLDFIKKCNRKNLCSQWNYLKDATIELYCCICKTAPSKRVWIFLKHLILASIFSLSCPSKACNSSRDKELKSAAGIGGGGGNT